MDQDKKKYFNTETRGVRNQLRRLQMQEQKRELDKNTYKNPSDKVIKGQMKIRQEIIRHKHI